MKKLLYLLILIFSSSIICSQDNFTNITDNNYQLEFSEIWKGETFQGIVGDENQRIQIRFLEITKDSTYSNIYIVSGKSIVKNNVCDFIGTFRIAEININEKKLELEKWWE